MNGPITFFYPSRVLGGAELLFVRLARHLAALGHPVVVADYPDGFLRRSLENEPGVRLLEYHPWRRLPLPSGARMVMPLSHLMVAGRDLDLGPDARLAAWGLHPYNVLSLFPKPGLVTKWPLAAIRLWLRTVLAGERGQVRKALRRLHERGGLYFMDEENLGATEAMLGSRFEAPRLLPVPLEAKPGFGDRRGFLWRPERLDLAWLGRITDHKVYSLLRVVEEADRLARARALPVRMHVVGDGEMKDWLRRELARFPRIEPRLVGTLEGAALEVYLAEHAGVLFAMGTSALEGARLGVPTVLLDVSFKPLPPDYRFRWLFETSGFTLGRMIAGRAPAGGRSFSEIIDAVLEPGGRERLGEACRAYLAAHHDLPAVAARLLGYLETNEARWNEFEAGGLLKPGLKRRLWSSLSRRGAA